MSLSIRGRHVSGHVDVLNVSGIAGWIVDLRRPAISPTLTLRVDGVVRAEIACEIDRPDIRAFGHPVDRSGFLFLFGTPPRREVKLAIDGETVFAAEASDAPGATWRGLVPEELPEARPDGAAAPPPPPRQDGSILSSAWPVPQSFRDVVVTPIEAIIQARPGVVFRGGPAWPRFGLQLYPRQCRGLVPRPVDARPLASEVADEMEDGIWCGPVVEHFGHMIADFGMRILRSAQASPDRPLVFSTRPGQEGPLPGFFWDILRVLQVDLSRVVLVRRPTLFRHLDVHPQAERMYGGGPSRAHLDRMDRLAPAGTPAGADAERLFVSRGRLAMGRIAGESYLDELLADAGWLVLHPEALPLAEQLRLYAGARQIVFSEGSAIHALQLLGRIRAEIVVLVRRPRNRIARGSVRARTPRLTYVDAVRGLVGGLDPGGGPARSRALTILDEDRFLRRLAAAGLDLSEVWSAEAYAARRDTEIAAYVALRRRLAVHPGDAAAIEACLDRLGLR